MYTQPIVTKVTTNKYSYSPTTPTDLNATSITGAVEIIDEYKQTRDVVALYVNL